jgi:hypothetical protein
MKLPKKSHEIAMKFPLKPMKLPLNPIKSHEVALKLP